MIENRIVELLHILIFDTDFVFSLLFHNQKVLFLSSKQQSFTYHLQIFQKYAYSNLNISNSNET